VLHPDQFPSIRFTSNSGGLFWRTNSGRLTLRGQLEVLQIKRDIEALMDCSQGSDTINCDWAGALSFSELSIEVPKLLEIPSRDEIAITASLLFRRENDPK